jgi:hypothetical protein
METASEERAGDSSGQSDRTGDSEKTRMSNVHDQTKSPPREFDFSAFPPNTLFHDRRTGCERRTKLIKQANTEQHDPQASGERRAKKERRRRIDPTTFDKQYTDDEMEFMNAVQRFKEQSGKAFPSYGEVLKLAVELGYRQFESDPGPAVSEQDDPELITDPS